LLLTINLSDSQLNWRKRLGSPFVKGSSTFDTKDYWEYTDWFHPDYTISSSTVAQYTVTDRNDLYDVDDDVYTVVRVDSDDADGNWAFYQWVDDQWFKTGKQNGTIQLKNTLYNVADVDAGWDSAEWDIAGWDKNYTNELLNILIALREDVFVGPYKLYWKEMFFAILRYIYSEQTNLDWVAKTTFLQLNRKTPGELLPRTFDVGAEKDILDYLDLVKPYHSKIETIFDARTFDEEINASADEVVDIRVQTNTSGSTETDDSRAWRMFIDNTGTRIYETMLDDDKTTAAVDIDASETSITVADALKLIVPFSNTGATWTKVDLSGLGMSSVDMDWKGGAVNGATIVVSGEKGNIITSTDGGVTWAVTHTSSNSNSNSRVRYGNEYFLYVDNGGLARYSTNGISWTNSNQPMTSFIDLATDGNGTWIAAKGNALEKTTDADFIWASQNDANYSLIKSIAYGDGKWITAVGGYNFVGISYTTDISPSTAVWTNVDLSGYATVVNGVLADVQFINYVNNKWFIGLQPGLLTSDDGIAWESITLAGIGSYDEVNGIAYGGGLYTVIIDDAASFSSSTPSIMTSPDLLTWTHQSHPFGDGHDFAGIVYAPTTKKFLGFGRTYSNSTSPSYMSGMIESSDGTSGTSSGTIVIDAERINFTGVSTNTLTGCIRGIAGTAPATHTSGASVVPAGALHALPVEPDPEAYNAFNDYDTATKTTTTIQASTNTQAVLINVGKGTI